MARSRWWRSCTGQQALVHATSSFSLFSIIADDAEAMVGCRKQPEQCHVVEQSCRATISFRKLPLFLQDSFSSCSSTCNFAAERPPVHVRATLGEPRSLRAYVLGPGSSAVCRCAGGSACDGYRANGRLALVRQMCVCAACVYVCVSRISAATPLSSACAAMLVRKTRQLIKEIKLVFPPFYL